MNYILLGTIWICVVAVLIFLLRHLNKSTLNRTIIKIYEIIKHLQQNLDSIPPCNLVLSIRKIHVVLKIIQNCLIVIKSKISTSKISVILDDFIRELDVVLKTTQNVDVTNVQEIKEKINLTLTKIELIIREVAEYLKITLEEQNNTVKTCSTDINGMYTLHVLTEQLKAHIIKLEKDE